MKLFKLRNMLALALALTLPSIAVAAVEPRPDFAMGEKMLISTKTGARRSDSTWVYLKPLATGSAVTAAVADTFYFDLVDAAFNHASYGSYDRTPLTDTLAYAGANRITAMVRDSLHAFSVVVLFSAANGDADSVQWQLDTNVWDHNRRDANWGGGSSVWQSLFGQGGGAGVSTFSSVTALALANVSTTVFPMFRPAASTAALPASALSRTVVYRGLRYFRLIIKRRSEESGGSPTKYAVKVVYPRVARSEGISPQ